MARLNKKILCFVDEYGTAGEAGFALGCLFVWARECGRADKAFSDLLPDTVNEVHASKIKSSHLRQLLEKLAQSGSASQLVMLNRLGDGHIGSRPEIYAKALVETVKTGIKQFAKANGIGTKIGNIEIVLDRNEQNTHIDFLNIMEAAQANDGRFRAVNWIVQIDSAASRMLQLADIVAHSRVWIEKGEEKASGLSQKFGIATL